MILTKDDFTSTVVFQKVEKQADYLDADLVRGYMQQIAREFDIPTDNLPDDEDVGEIMKQVLKLRVMVRIASDSIGSNLKQLAEGVVVDEWQSRYNVWKEQYTTEKSKLSAKDIYDPANPPYGKGNASVMTWGRA